MKKCQFILIIPCLLCACNGAKQEAPAPNDANQKSAAETIAPDTSEEKQ